MGKESITRDWVLSYFQDVDSRNVDRVLAHYASDATFKFGNQDAARGTSAIGQVLSGFFDQIDGISHEPIEIWTGPSNAVFESMVTFTVGKNTVTVPAVSIIRGNDSGKISDFRFVMDAAPVFELIGSA